MVFGGMYHEHFGLTQGLFGEGIAADAAVFRSPRHDELIGRYKLAFGSTSSALVLRGPPGVGKTTLTSAALRAMSTRLALAWVNGVPTNGTELLELMLVELGIGTLNTTRIERLQLWRQLQAELRATDSRLCIAVERAEDLSHEVLHALDQLTAPDAAGNPGANLVLLGHATLDEHLAPPLLDSLRQRVRVRSELAPFTPAEFRDYLRHQVVCAGGNFDRLFAPDAVAALYRWSNGVARLANTLCETALDLSAAQNLRIVSAEQIERAATMALGLVAAADTREPLAAASTGGSAQPAPSAPIARVAVRLGSGKLAATPAAAAIPSQQEANPATRAWSQRAGDFEYDGGDTDVSDAAPGDFPILTDVVDPPKATAALEPTAAKSIDDISSSMAETLFGDDELDLLTAALASAADWTDGQPAERDPAKATPPAQEPKAAKNDLGEDDPFDLFGLDEHAPLELLDGSAPSPGDRARRRATSSR